MLRLCSVLAALTLLVAACGDSDDAPEDLSGICPPVGAVAPDLNPFDVLATGSAEEIEQSLEDVSDLYHSLLDAVPDDVGYPPEVLSATTTIPPTTAPPGPTTTAAEADDGDGDAPVEPTPHRDLELVIEVLDDVRDVLDDNDYDVVAAEADLRDVVAFADPQQLVEVVEATGRLRQLIQQRCPAAPPPTTAGG